MNALLSFLYTLLRMMCSQRWKLSDWILTLDFYIGTVPAGQASPLI